MCIYIYNTNTPNIIYYPYKREYSENMNLLINMIIIQFIKSFYSIKLVLSLYRYLH